MGLLVADFFPFWAEIGSLGFHLYENVQLDSIWADLHPFVTFGLPTYKKEINKHK